MSPANRDPQAQAGTGAPKSSCRRLNRLQQRASPLVPRKLGRGFADRKFRREWQVMCCLRDRYHQRDEHESPGLQAVGTIAERNRRMRFE